jgi:hypothetical protein
VAEPGRRILAEVLVERAGRRNLDYQDGIVGDAVSLRLMLTPGQ